MHRIAVIDYGMGNLRSVSKALESASKQRVIVDISADPDRILSADRVVFPGVGAIRDTMLELQRQQLDDIVLEVTKSKPFLGICLGMQALLSHSHENNGVDTLNIIPGQVRFFGNPVDHQGNKLKVPHMGWNTVHQTVNHPLWKDIAQDSRFYFVHSYFAQPDDDAVIAGTSAYPEVFTAAICKDNVFASQFHPEKSQYAGLKLLENFVNWDGQY